MTTSPQTLRFKPGIMRDGTRLSAQGFWIDGQWTRFRNSRARSMGGYRMMTQGPEEIVRSFGSFFSGGNHDILMGTVDGLWHTRVTGIAATTPEQRSIVAHADQLWQIDVVYDPIINNKPTFVAHPGHNLNDISSDVETPIYFGDATSTAGVLADLDPELSQVSGGICVVHPYLTFFGNNGYFGWGGPNKLNDMTTLAGGGAANPTAQKIVAGRPIQGGNGPAGIYWSLNALLRTSFIGGTATWAFDEITRQVSIMSSRCMASLDGNVWYWAGLNCFYVFNGAQVQELENPFNADWFFEGINLDQRQKCFAFANKRYGEIWWCYPRGSATECTHAVIFNTRSGEWYDTILPHSGRGGAMSPGLFPYPILSGVDADSFGYRLWQHEYGVNEIRGSTVYPVRSWIESSDLTLVTAEQGAQDKTLTVTSVEPDIKQTGEMTLTITGNANARSPVRTSEAITFQPGPVSEAEQLIHPKEERRQMRFKWESNTRDGSFELGSTVAHIGPGSGRQTG